MEDKSKKQNIFDKLTDPKLYTGAHKERFDKDGHGKGLAGRVDNNGQKDLKNMVDSKSKVVQNNDKAKSGKTVSKLDKIDDINKKVENLNIEDKDNNAKIEKKEEPKKQSIFDKLTDPKLYTGAHKERFDKDGKGKGLAGRVDEVAPKDLKTMVDSKGKADNINDKPSSKSTKTSTKVDPNKPSIFDKLTDPKLYTGAHKERFDKDGHGKGLEGRVDKTGPKDLSNMVSTKK